jgi:hypothetical protein
VRRAFAIAALTVGQGAFVTARAGGVSPIPLEYSAPAGCLDRVRFLREVSERLPRSAAKVQTVRVVIRPLGDGFVARLEVVDAAGAMAEREISGSRCDKVSTAMALVVALVLTELSGQRQQIPVRRPGHSESAEPTAPESAASRARAPTVRAEPPAVELLPGADSIRSRAGPERSIPVETGFLGTVTGGITPAAAWGGLGYVEIGGFLRPAARLNLGVRTTRAVERGPGVAHFEWLGGRLDGCWATLSFGAKAGVAGCASFEAGVLRAYGTDIDIPDSSVNPWFCLELLLRPALRAGDVVFQVELGPTFPLVRRSFRFGTEDDTEAKIHDIPAVSWHIGLGVGARL